MASTAIVFVYQWYKELLSSICRERDCQLCTEMAKQVKEWLLEAKKGMRTWRVF